MLCPRLGRIFRMPLGVPLRGAWRSRCPALGGMTTPCPSDRDKLRRWRDRSSSPPCTPPSRLTAALPAGRPPRQSPRVPGTGARGDPLRPGVPLRSNGEGPPPWHRRSLVVASPQPVEPVPMPRPARAGRPRPRSARPARSRRARCPDPRGRTTPSPSDRDTPDAMPPQVGQRRPLAATRAVELRCPSRDNADHVVPASRSDPPDAPGCPTSRGMALAVSRFGAHDDAMPLGSGQAAPVARPLVVAAMHTAEPAHRRAPGGPSAAVILPVLPRRRARSGTGPLPGRGVRSPTRHRSLSNRAGAAPPARAPRGQVPSCHRFSSPARRLGHSETLPLEAVPHLHLPASPTGPRSSRSPQSWPLPPGKEPPPPARPRRPARPHPAAGAASADTTSSRTRSSSSRPAWPTPARVNASEPGRWQVEAG
jgi:hypothetical protein